MHLNASLFQVSRKFTQTPSYAKTAFVPLCIVTDVEAWFSALISTDHGCFPYLREVEPLVKKGRLLRLRQGCR